MVARVPQTGAGDFRLGSQVIVRESQIAVFYRDGKSLDSFPAGRHTITTANLPVFPGLLKLVTGGNNVFTAEVYFVNMREFTDLKWGTPQPISLRDTDLGYARVRGFGQYTMQVADPKRFVDQIVGTQGLYQTSQIEDYLRNAIISKVTDVLGENMTSIFDLPKLMDELSAATKAKVARLLHGHGHRPQAVPGRLAHAHRRDRQGHRRAGQHGRHRQPGRLHEVQDGTRRGRCGPEFRRHRRRCGPGRRHRHGRWHGRHDRQRHGRRNAAPGSPGSTGCTGGGCRQRPLLLS